jgi:phosphoglycolate phosphatase
MRISPGSFPRKVSLSPKKKSIIPNRRNKIPIIIKTLPICKCMAVYRFNMQFTQIIFDLDGTLSDPHRGIRNSLEYALDKLGIEARIERNYSGFIGPPLHEGFQNLFGLSVEDTERAVYYFREYYGTKGLYENKLYAGIRELLKRIKEQGFGIHLATSKLEKYAIKVLEYHTIHDYFTVISGAAYKGKGAEKSALIKKILEKTEINREHFLMVGDKKYDVLGAKKTGVKSLGVLYGFGSKDELEKAGVDYLVNTVDELTNFLTNSS